MSSNEIVIDVRNLSKRYEIYNTPRDRLKQLVLPHLHQAANRAGVALGISKHHSAPRYFREFWALTDVSFQVRGGETLGIIGRNGSGKSTLLQILAGTLAPTSGEAKVTGRIAALLELGSGFNPEFTGCDNVFLNGRILGLTQKEIEARYEQIVEFADIGEFIDEPVKTYSSGMFLRLAFAVQAHIDASIVIIDEALAVGDVFFRQKCYARLEQLKTAGAAILLVSHSMPDIEQFCERAILLDHGEPRFIGLASEAAKHYYLLHQAESRKGQQQESSPVKMPVEKPVEHVIDRPPVEAFLDLTNKSQISNGQARCVGVAVCNAAGEPCNSFRQGERAIFYYEFELNEDIGVPICGIVIKNDRGVTVHGKNSWQYDDNVPASLGSGSKVWCKQEINLDLGLGEYVFEIGLASVSTHTWKHRERVSHEEMSAKRMRICHITDAGSFSVGPAVRNNIQFLTHHGLANLPGKMTITVESPSSHAERASYTHTRKSQVTQTQQNEQPTLFHVTHWKAGSQWIYKILREIAPDRIITPQLNGQHYQDTSLVRGAVYPTVYATREQFYSVSLPDNYRKLIIIRDLRDTLISGYFSIRYSHTIISADLARWRERLEAMTTEAGLLMLMDEWLPASARIQESWIEAGEKFIRYEDLLENDSEILEEVLIKHCEIQVSPERLREVVDANRFESLTGGRKPGEENIMAHERKGVSGDWRNYFTPLVADKFNERHGELSSKAGYASNTIPGK
ncbi:MAG: ATP-binding cassette domain-containing protein [Thiobacillus sp.]|nr:ATP-binding cassette domain-containing protein [Thiobacillus sp.]MDP2977196.1 ATP-binding cassette domain-containing protein [Thiobacillus sp.]